jgi:hypothetical protein
LSSPTTQQGDLSVPPKSGPYERSCSAAVLPLVRLPFADDDDTDSDDDFDYQGTRLVEIETASASESNEADEDINTQKEIVNRHWDMTSEETRALDIDDDEEDDDDEHVSHSQEERFATAEESTGCVDKNDEEENGISIRRAEMTAKTQSLLERIQELKAKQDLIRSRMALIHQEN